MPLCSLTAPACDLQRTSRAAEGPNSTPSRNAGLERATTAIRLFADLDSELFAGGLILAISSRVPSSRRPVVTEGRLTSGQTANPR